MKQYKVKLTDGTYIALSAKSYKVWDDGDLTFSNDDDKDQILVVARGQWIFVVKTDEVRV
jgi:hypothetical protein